MSTPCFFPSRRRLRWILVPLLLALTASWLVAATFPLPIPTRPTTFPLERPTKAGKVVMWGNDPCNRACGLTNIPIDLTNAVQLAVQEASCIALTSSGQLASWGTNFWHSITIPPEATNVVQIATDVGGILTLALRADGTVVAWGTNRVGGPLLPPGLSSVIGISASLNAYAALRADGSFAIWQTSDPPLIPPPPELATNVVQLSLGFSHALALRGDGTVIAWGRDEAGNLSVLAGLRGVVSVAAGDGRNQALMQDGTVIGWGDNWRPAGQWRGLSNVVALSSNSERSVALKSNGRVVSRLGKVPDNLTNAVGVFASLNQEFAIVSPWSLFPHRATAVCDVVNGFLVIVEITDPGLGYPAVPQFELIGGGGTGAVLVPVMDNGRVISFTVENPGRGYTSAPQIIIAAPPLPPPSLSVAVSRVVVRQQVTPGVTYRLESSPDLQAWSPVGDPFVAESELEQREINVTDGALHFRLVEMP